MENYIWPEITADTPIEEVKRIHQQIWDYAIEHGEKPETPYKSDCIACEYVKQLLYSTVFWNEHLDCQFCPIIWPEHDGDRFCFLRQGLYTRWCYVIGEERTELARQIRDLPWKFESEENTSL